MPNINPTAILGAPNNYEGASATLTIAAGSTTATDGVDLLGYRLRTVLVSTAGTSGDIQYKIHGSVDGTNWIPLAVRADASASFSASTMTQQWATGIHRYLDTNSYVRYVRVTPSANTLDGATTVIIAAAR